MTKALDVVSQSKQPAENSLSQLKKNLNWILPWEQTEFQSIVLDLPVRILKRLMCLKSRCFLCVETSESPPPPPPEKCFSIQKWFVTRLSANLSFIKWEPIMTVTDVIITVLTRTMLALSFLTKKSNEFGSQSNSIEFYHRLIWGVHLIPRFYCVVMEYIDCWLY